MQIRKIARDDICLWPDGSWCFHEDLSEYNHMSDDYEVIPAGSERYVDFLALEANRDCALS